jgi:GT2 family glycosyltransferase
MQKGREQVLRGNLLGRFAGIRLVFRKSNDTPERTDGRKALKEGRVVDAIGAFEQHLRMRPKDGQSWVRLGNAFKDAGRYDQAEVAYARGCALKPKSPHAWLQRGHLARFTGDKTLAASYFRRSFELDGNAEAGRELLRLAGDDAVGANVSGLVGCVDGIHAKTILGWAVDPDRPGESAQVEFVQSGKIVGSGHTSIARPDVLSAGFPSAQAGFKIALQGEYSPQNGPVTARLVASKKQLSNSPYTPSEDDHVSKWLQRWDGSDSEALREMRKRMDAETSGLKLSIVMPIHNPDINWLAEAITSVREQLCSHWELLCIDDASSGTQVVEKVREISDYDPRVKYFRTEENVGISGATNIGIMASSGEYVAFMDHDDLLEPEAVYRVLLTSKSDADLIYSDEVITGEHIDEILSVVSRPAFSYDYYISHPYFVHFVAVKRTHAIALGGLDINMSISMDVDFTLRVIEKSEVIAHIPAPLYRWRTHHGSVGHSKMSAVMDATRQALERHHARVGADVKVSNGLTFNTFRHDYSSTARVLAIVPTKDRLDLLEPCVESLLKTTDADIVIVDHESSDKDVIKFFSSLPERVKVIPFTGPFNFSKMNNHAVSLCGEDYEIFLFANNDIEAIELGWMDHMRGLCMRSDVGAVGSLLLYSDGSIQHGGVVMNVGGPAEHVYKNAPSKIGDNRNPGYISGLVCVRDYMAVTGACLMIKADVFKKVGGFDPLLAVGFNDIDLCLRIRESGLKVLYDGHAVLYHRESATRMTSKQLRHPKDTALMSARWADVIAGSDPYFSPSFSNEAPAEHIVANPIDPFVAAQVWRRRPSEFSGRGISVTPPSVQVI